MKRWLTGCSRASSTSPFRSSGRSGHSVAALTVPYVATTYSVLDLATVRRHAAQAAGEIGLVLAPESSQ
ncbi:hypothetical protein [Mesorhizobium sp. B2-4-17]|uniref:hypothetical protein n=1 Tax=Mesorhizobium sp. B2-4-17 TaxID=2589932 RepID=UPI00112713E1|nr:hypothetical protein [Mesorhizobium sp. B2-4-17]TPK83001.1 hypothetical protein FJ548_19265 [Mesorhizobium sp. B2-4-17]